MDLLKSLKLGRGGVPQRDAIIVPKGYEPEEYLRRRSTKALANVEISEHGTATVNCPYCAFYYRTKNPVDVTGFLDAGGNKSHKTECSKGHTLNFKSIPQWREERQDMGLQVKS